MKNRVKIVFVFFCSLLVFNSCVTNKQTELLQNIDKQYPRVTKPEEYKIIHGDLLTINVFTLDEYAKELFKIYEPGFSWDQFTSEGVGGNQNAARNQDGSFRVKPTKVYADGTINFPHVGRIYVEGFTILEIRNIISERINEIADGSSVEVSLYNRYFSVLGEMGSNRFVMMNNQITIYQALATATTISTNGDKSKVSILRQTKDGTVLKTFDLRSKDIIDSEFYYIQANDVVYVPQSKRRFFGSATSFVGLFGLLSSITGIIVFAIRI